MVQVKTKCGACSQRLAIDSAFEGEVIKCPSCEEKLQVPNFPKEVFEAPAPESGVSKDAWAELVSLRKDLEILKKAFVAKVKEGKVLASELEETRKKLRQVQALPTVQPSTGSSNSLARQNTALQHRVDALSLELEEKTRALGVVEGRSAEFERRVRFLEQSAEDTDNARSSINSFIENVQRNHSEPSPDEPETPGTGT